MLARFQICKSLYIALSARMQRTLSTEQLLIRESSRCTSDAFYRCLTDGVIQLALCHSDSIAGMYIPLGNPRGWEDEVGHLNPSRGCPQES